MENLKCRLHLVQWINISGSQFWAKKALIVFKAGEARSPSWHFHISRQFWLDTNILFSSKQNAGQTDPKDVNKQDSSKSFNVDTSAKVILLFQKVDIK